MSKIICQCTLFLCALFHLLPHEGVCLVAAEDEDPAATEEENIKCRFDFAIVNE